jgi:hypothetical protein
MFTDKDAKLIVFLTTSKKKPLIALIHMVAMATIS